MRVLRALTRIYVEPGRLDGAVAFYERLFGEPCRLRFAYEAVGLELAEVGAVLLLCGTEEALRGFRPTAMTVMVSSIEESRAALAALGAEIVEPPKRVPTGSNMRVRHPDGTLVEYVEHHA
jgi:predicted enzyme related to lactoylglutathione lyase